MSDSRQLSNQEFVLRCRAGLSSVLRSEMLRQGIIRRKTSVKIMRQRNHDFIFVNVPLRRPDPRLRTADQVLRCLVFGRFEISPGKLDRIARRVKLKSRGVRLVVTADGQHFDRNRMKRWLSHELKQRHVVVRDTASTDLFTFLIDEKYYICVEEYSATDAPEREFRVAERVGSLPPTIAAAMVLLGDPRPGETVLDSMCGSGTILAEAHAYEPNSRLFGLDLSRASLRAAKSNLNHAKELKIGLGDARSTGLNSSSVNLFIVNLPWGLRFGDPSIISRLYRDVLGEMVRLWRPGSRAVLLSIREDVIHYALSFFPVLSCTSTERVKVRGQWATIVVVQ